jgi:hypothetical protein
VVVLLLLLSTNTVAHLSLMQPNVELMAAIHVTCPLAAAARCIAQS